MDNVQQYQGQSICNPPAKPGVAKLRALLRKTYGNYTFYAARPCADDPTSEHTEGRALDWMVSLRRPDEKAKADAFLRWLLAAGPDGTPAAMARRMGIMYIGWNSRIWRSYRGPGWGELKGCLSKPSQSWDTYCHRDHIHFSFTWDGAAGRTSYWDGTPETTPTCPVTQPSGNPVPLRGPLRWVTLARPKVVVDTSTGFGNYGRVCRLEESRWSGDTQLASVRLTGARGKVPSDSPRVRVRVTAVNANAPAGISVWPSGSRPSSPAFQSAMNSSTSKVLQLRLGAGGSISLATGTGNTAYRVELLGYQTPR